MKKDIIWKFNDFWKVCAESSIRASSNSGQCSDVWSAGIFCKPSVVRLRYSAFQSRHLLKKHHVLTQSEHNILTETAYYEHFRWLLLKICTSIGDDNTSNRTSCFSCACKDCIPRLFVEVWAFLRALVRCYRDFSQGKRSLENCMCRPVTKRREFHLNIYSATFHWHISGVILLENILLLSTVLRVSVQSLHNSS